MHYIGLFGVMPALLGGLAQAGPVMVRGDIETDTVVTTDIYTITSCGPTVSNCPVTPTPRTVTSTVTTTTVVCTETGAPTGAPTWSSKPKPTGASSSHASAPKEHSTTKKATTEKPTATHKPTSAKSSAKSSAKTTAKTTAKTSAKPKPTPTGNLPGLNSVQSKHARDIIGEAKKEGLGLQGCEAGIATALVEVKFPHYLSYQLALGIITNTTKVEHSYLRQQRCSRFAQVPARCGWRRPRQRRHLPAACLYL